MHKKSYYIGLDIGGTKCAVCLGNDQAIPIDKIKFPTPKGFTPTLKLLFEAIKQITERNKIDLNSQIKSIGISCGGPLDEVRGIVQSPPNLPDWDDIHIVDIIKKELDIPTFLMNDANACALAEWQHGAGQNTSNMIFITMGTGLGAGLILNGRIYAGTCGMAGEVGHTRLAKNGPEGYGKKGSFEGFCGGSGIALHAEQLAREYHDKTTLDEYFDIVGEKIFSAKYLNEATLQNNKFALSVFEKTGTYLGRGLATLIDILNPEAIVIGSIFERCENFLRPSMELVLQEECLRANLQACKIVPAKLNEQIGDYACLIVAHYNSSRQ